MRKFIRTLGLYWNTLRYLRPIQIANRIYRKLPRNSIKITFIPSTRPSSQNPKEKKWTQSIRMKSSMLASEEFYFLGESGNLKDIGWNGTERSMLWRYNQHYFDDLNAVGAETRKPWHISLLHDWLENNPQGRGIAWHPYPISLRIVNWIKWSFAGNTLSDPLIQSLFIQAMYLKRSIEWHLLANHLFANAKALVFAGVFFDGKVAQNCLRKGLSILKSQLHEQILPDGGHFERSPLYHAIILEDILDIINLCKTYNCCQELVALCLNIVPKMLFWLRVMTHPDGQISLFNDSAFDIAPCSDQLHAYAERLGIMTKQEKIPCCVHLKDSGYIRLEADKAVVLIDVGKLGPDYQLGHAHADTLSFEFSYDGQRILVNGGTSCYGLSAQRLKERQTCSHNTVEIDGRSSSEVWSGFRVAKRAHPHNLLIINKDTQKEIHCSHSGYSRWIRTGSRHSRIWIVDENGLKIFDRVQGSVDSRAIFRIHPAISVEQEHNSIIHLKLPSDKNLIINSSSDTMQLISDYYSENFGHLQCTNALELSLNNINNYNSCLNINWNYV